MLTTCTACSTQFRLSAAQLRTAHGLVRCGHCQTVFDAFETLREEAAITASEPTDSSSVMDTPSEPATDEAPILTATAAEGNMLETAGIHIKPAQEKRQPLAEDLFADLEDETVTGNIKAETPRVIEDTIHEWIAPVRDPKAYKRMPLPQAENLTPSRHDPWATTGWSAGILLLMLLLAAQLVNANHVALSRNLVIGPSVGAVYAKLGQPIAPSRALHQWFISNTNVTSDPDTPGALSITGTLANNAGFAQPWPLLRIALTDRYGDLLRARDFPANEYLPADQANAWLAAGMATRFRIDVVDPGPDAVGFQVQPCFDFGHTRSCASDSNHE